MIVDRVIAIARAPVGRWLVTAIGLAVVAVLLARLGLHQVGAVLSHGAAYFPLVFVLEAGVLACTMLALRSLYPPGLVPTRQLVRAGLIGYAVMGLAPAGRSAAEATRAALLARHVGGVTAAVAALQIQGAALLANAVISVPAALVVLWVVGPSLVPAAIGANCVVTAVLGGGILFAGRRSRIGTWLGRRVSSIGDRGAEFDAAMRRAAVPWPAIGWELVGRVIQLVQNAVLVVAVGGALGLVPALCSEGIHLVGAAVGDLLPAQLGATEANYALSAPVLALAATGAVAIPLLAHLAQLGWVAIGAVVPLVWRPKEPT